MGNLDFSANADQLKELAAYMASQINVPTIGIGGGYAPIGTIISVMGTTAPQDYLACDGTVYNIADYPQLADYFESQFGESNHFGGNGTTTFAVPDLRGEFLRGTGTNSHENQGDGANVGVHQDGTAFDSQFVADNRLYIRLAGGTNGVLTTKNADAEEFISSTKLGKIPYTDENVDTYPWITSRPTNTSVLYCIKAVVAGEVYSTEERVVGTWIDGKPLYQRTLVKTGGVANGTIYFQNELSDVNVIIKKDVLFRTTHNNGAWESEFCVDNTDHLQVIVSHTDTDGAFVYTILANRTVTEMRVTVLYTKTTD